MFIIKIVCLDLERCRELDKSEFKREQKKMDWLSEFLYFYL